MPLRFCLIGAGFWAHYQLAAWQELPDAVCVAVCDCDASKAAALAARFGVEGVFDDVERMLERTRPDFVDIVASPAAHPELVRLAAAHGIAVICQKPLADSAHAAQALLAACQAAGVPLLVHENFRWQAPIRAAKAILDRQAIGAVFRARIQFVCSFPVFDNQPFLRRQRRFIISDVGTHLLDVSRFLFGEFSSVYCQAQKINPGIAGEDVATLMLTMAQGGTVLCELSYASRTEYERFPETFLFVEGSEGSLELVRNCQLRLTNSAGTQVTEAGPPHYTWADPAYEVVHGSIVDCQRNLLAHLSGLSQAETTAEDNLHTLRLVDAAYQSADTGHAIQLPRPSNSVEKPALGKCR